MISGLKKWARVVLRRNAGLRRGAQRVRTRVNRLRFRWHARSGVDTQLIVFESFGGRSYAGSPRALYVAMLADPRFADHRFVWVLRDPKRAADEVSLADIRTTVVTHGTGSYYGAFARAGVWISNSILLPELVPDKQLYVQTWHGIGIKRIGFDVTPSAAGALDDLAEIHERYRIEAPKIGLFVCPAPFGRTVFASAFGLPESGSGSPFVETGNPSNDALATATAADVAAARTRLGVPSGVRTVLYAPTFRDDRHKPGIGYVSHQPVDLEALATALGPRHALLFRTHYLVSAATDPPRQGGMVRDVSAVDDVADLLLATDVLITDYSSMCSEFALLDRPMIFYVYDLDHYVQDLRGFYFPPEELPGPLVRTPDEVVKAVLDPGLAARFAEQRRAFRSRMCPSDDGNACARVLDLIVG